MDYYYLMDYHYLRIIKKLQLTSTTTNCYHLNIDIFHDILTSDD